VRRFPADRLRRCRRHLRPVQTSAAPERKNSATVSSAASNDATRFKEFY